MREKKLLFSYVCKGLRYKVFFLKGSKTWEDKERDKGKKREKNEEDFFFVGGLFIF